MEFVEAEPASVPGGDVGEDVNIAAVSAQRQDLHAIEPETIKVERQTFGFFVAHPFDAQPNIEFVERRAQAFEVLLGRARETVEVLRRAGRPMRQRCDTTDEQILDPVTVERFEDQPELELRWIVQRRHCSSVPARRQAPR